MLIATIVSENYLPQARVLAGSFLAHHPDGRVVVLVFDGSGDHLGDSEPFDVITLDELDIPPREARRMATIYTVTELATALKPFLLRHLVVDRHEPCATYIDSDIEVFAPLDDLAELALQHSLVLTPHRLGPLKAGVPPIEFIFSRSGAYNLGFASVSAEAVPFLDWWSERCRRDCIDAVPEGFFVDQRWVDLAVTYFPHHALQDPGCNVAYWNLDARPLTFDPDREGSGFEAGGVPLRFFHFSGFTPDVPHMLTPYQGPKPWILLSEHPALRTLCARYAAQLEAAGLRESRKLGYRYSTAANGMPLDGAMRRVFRQELLRREADDREGLAAVDDLPDPFEATEVDRFVSLLRTPGPDSDVPRIPRYLHEIHRSRPDLQGAFPDLTGPSGNHFLWWMQEMGHQELGVPEALVPDEDDLDSSTVGEVPEQHGVRLVGDDAPALAAALQAIGEPEGDDADIDLICVTPDRMLWLLDSLGPAFRSSNRGRYTVGVWSWAVEDFPAELLPAVELVDEIWAVSRHAAEAIELARPADDRTTPVHVVPPPVVEPPPSRRGRAELGLPDGWVGLCCFDVASCLERQNPLGVIEAFCRAFPSANPDEGPHLVLKSSNGRVDIAELERLRMRVVDRPDIHISDGDLDEAEQHAFVAGCDAYVSLHRAEGFGSTMAQAMSLAKPVIATGYSGNLEFMHPGNSFLVDYEMVPIGPGHVPYPAESQWAEPDLDAAAKLLRQVVDDPAGARAAGEQAQRDLRELHSPKARGVLVAERLAAIRATVAAARAAQAQAEAEARAAAEAAELAESQPPPTRGRIRGAGSKLTGWRPRRPG